MKCICNALKRHYDFRECCLGESLKLLEFIVASHRCGRLIGMQCEYSIHKLAVCCTCLVASFRPIFLLTRGEPHPLWTRFNDDDHRSTTVPVDLQGFMSYVVIPFLCCCPTTSSLMGFIVNVIVEDRWSGRPEGRKELTELPIVNEAESKLPHCLVSFSLLIFLHWKLCFCYEYANFSCSLVAESSQARSLG